MQLSALDNCNSQDEVTDQLQSLPQDLDQSYQQIFSRFNQHHYESVLIIMQWLSFSKEPLSVDQICEVVAIVKVGDEKPKFQPGKKWNRGAVQRTCADLVTVTNGDKITQFFKINSDNNHIGTVKLAHFTVKEYPVAAHPSFNEGNASCLIAESCLGYLLQFTTHGSLDAGNIDNFQMARYTAEHWIDHARDVGEYEQGQIPSEMLISLIGDMFDSGDAFHTWIQLWHPELYLLEASLCASGGI